MKHLLALALCCVLLPPAAAQRRPGRMGGGYRGGIGGGAGSGIRAGYHPGIHLRGYRGFSRYGYGYGYGYGGYASYGIGYYGSYLGGYFSGYLGSPYISIYPSYGYYPEPYYQPGVYYPGTPYAAPPAAPIIINQFSPVWDYPQREPAHEPARIHEAPSSTSEARRPSGPPIYLIARNDDTIVAALSYEVDNNTLRYTTLKHESRRMPLGSVDRALSAKLNSERQVEFKLPPAKK
ncbi:MAG: hypothetical protein IT166_12695 [Bryobacterales bacterium]|nr:hypothetical protein [Bryobacterales bacterium]